MKNSMIVRRVASWLDSFVVKAGPAPFVGGRAVLPKGVRTFGRLVVLVGVLFSSMVVSLPQASASRIYMIRNWATNRCLDSNGVGNVYTMACQAGNDHQRWTWEISGKGPAGNDQVWLKNVATQRFLGVDSPSGPVYAGDSPADAYWEGIGPDWQHVQLSPNLWRCLDSNLGSNGVGQVYILFCNGGGYQQWKFE